MQVEKIGNDVEDVIGYYVHGHIEPGEFMAALGDRTVGPYDPNSIRQTYMTMTPIEDRNDTDMALHFEDEGEPVTVLLVRF